jgi:hypothetical protein
MDWASNLAWMPTLVFSTSLHLSKYFAVLSIVAKNKNIVK